MDKENGKANESSSGSSKVSNVQDPAALLNAASLFGAYWPRAGDANAANLFAAAGGFGLPPHAASLPFGMLPPTSTATSTSSTTQSGGGGTSRSSRDSGGTASGSHAAASSSATSSSSSAAAAAAAAAYSNAYNNTLSMAASQAASLGMPAASAAWWQMASHLAAQDYLAKLQASGLNFPAMGSPAELQYAAALGLPYLGGGGGHHKSDTKNSSKSHTNSGASSRDKYSSLSKMQDMHNSKANSSLSHSKSSSSSSSNNPMKYNSPSGLTIQPSIKLPGSAGGSSSTSANGGERMRKSSMSSDMSYLQSKLESKQKNIASTTTVKASSPSPSIFTNPLSLASNPSEKNSTSISNSTNPNSINSTSINSLTGLPSSILSDPNSILGGVRLPPDTEIIKYTSSIVGPKIPGTTNRGRKKTISLDPPSVSVMPSHSSTGLLIERTSKRPKLNDHDLSPPTTPTSDRVEVIKLPATNGSPSGLSAYNAFDSGGDAPLNLSLKPSTSAHNSSSSSSLNQLSNMSASIGMDRISRRKPGPKPRRVISTDPTGGAALNQMYLAEELPPRPSSRNEGSDGGSSTSSTSLPPVPPSSAIIGSTSTLSITTASLSSSHKEGRPRNLGRGVSKPKKNTVASLLAQSRALGIKPVPMLDPNASMNQQMNLLKSNILAAQQYIQEAGGDEKALNKFLQERFKGSLSDSSTVDASDSDNMTDSNQTDSEMEAEMAATAKKQKIYDERLLRVPLERGWRRETVIRGLTKSGGLKGDVTYSAPDSSNKFKQMSDVTQYLEYQKSAELTKDNFTFSCRVIIGDYLQPIPPEMQTDGNEYIHLTEEEVSKRLEELKASMRTSIPVEQRIEMARKQQAARAAARLDREQQRLSKEIERNERAEAARREKEARNQQILEAKRKRQEEIEKQKHEENQRKQQERELKRQQAAILKEQEKERRRQHLAMIKAMENRRKLEEKEKKKQQLLAEKQANKEKKLEQRKVEVEILTELRKPCEDLELNQNPLPKFDRIPNVKLCGKAFADILMVFEFLHNFGETLGFDMESLPTLDALQQAMLPNDHSFEAEEELFSVMTHLLVCAIEDPGIPNPARHTTIMGQSLRAADITHANLSEILRIYLYANATGEIKSLTGAHFERDREKRIADHHATAEEMKESAHGKNAQYYELLINNTTYKMSQLLRERSFMALSPTDKAAILAYICNELLQNKAVSKQIESTLDRSAHLKKDKWLLDSKIRKVKLAHNKKLKEEKAEAKEKSLNKSDLDDSNFDTSSLHKDDLLDEDENEMSENESVAESCGTQPDEDEDNKLSAEELGKKLEKLLKTSETQMCQLYTSLGQLRATTFGEDRYCRRYWSMPKAGGVFVEAIESAEPEEFENQLIVDQHESIRNGIRSLNELNNVIEKVEKIHDSSVDNEVSNIISNTTLNQYGFETHDSKRSTDDNENEHRKTPNRLSAVENGDLDTSEHTLAELQKSVDDMVQNLEQNMEERKLKESQQNDNIKQETPDKYEEESIANKKFNLFEKLGQCMERENKCDDLKADVKAELKEELKNEILKELKTEIKSELKPESPLDNDETKWFSILYRDGSSCEEIHLTTGNKWENGNVGACTKDITELKIPVFPPPGSSLHNTHHNCDSPPPLQMTAEESIQLEQIKKHGMPVAPSRKPIPLEERYGWWRISDPEKMREVLDNLHMRGVRERELKRTFIYWTQFMHRGQLVIDKGHPELTELTGENIENVIYADKDAPVPDESGSWSELIAHRVDINLLEQVENLEDKVANASMQVKGWKVPNRENQEYPMGEVFPILRERIASLEQNIERRYLKPPLGINTNIRTSAGSDPSTAVSATSPSMPSQEPSSPSSMPAQPVSSPADDIPKGLSTWREAVHRASTTAQLAMCLYALEGSIAWDKSIMKAVSQTEEFSLQNARKYNSKLSNCQFCSSGEHEDKLLLCDSCDRGYHTYCFKPKIDNIPEGDWYCHECMNKATGERNCIVCGKKASLTGTRLLVCEFCPRTYHTDCIQPQIFKVPRGKWYCSNCISRKPQRKPVKKNNASNKTHRDSESSVDQPPPSPAMSHSSVTTNEDMPLSNSLQSDVSNSSLINDSGCRPVTPALTTAQLQQQQAAHLAAQQAAQQAALQAKKEQKEKEKAQKKLLKELGQCQLILEDLECHDDAWPFLLPVNTKQFPTYKKIIKVPMDLSTIRKRLHDLIYKSKEDFSADVRQIFNNCETFNEDDSPVGKAGHCMRQFFEAKWNEHFCTSPNS